MDIRPSSSNTMVGMPGQDRRRPIELLGDEDAGYLMGKGQPAERQDDVRPGPQILADAVGTADQKAEIAFCRHRASGRSCGRTPRTP